MRTLIAILAVAAVVACAAADTPFRWPLGEDAVWTLNDHHLRDDIPSGNFTLTRYHNYTEVSICRERAGKQGWRMDDEKKKKLGLCIWNERVSRWWCAPAVFRRHPGRNGRL